MGGVVDDEIALDGDAPSPLPEEKGSRMKTLVAVLIALGGGTTLGVAAVYGVQAVADPDNSVETDTANETIDVLQYGQRG